MKKAAACLIALSAIVSFAFIAPKSAKTKQINVVIDAGHGGNDYGATIDSYTEKAIVEQITKKIKEQNSNKEVIIHLTRTGDELIPLDERTKLINNIKPDLMLSLHVNSNKNGLSSGMEFYVYKDGTTYEKSNGFAQKLSGKFAKNHNLKIRGIKDAKFTILKKSEVPSVLVELGFLSNEADKKYLTDENEQNRIASTILEFISELD